MVSWPGPAAAEHPKTWRVHLYASQLVWGSLFWCPDNSILDSSVQRTLLLKSWSTFFLAFMFLFVLEKSTPLMKVKLLFLIVETCTFTLKVARACWSSSHDILGFWLLEVHSWSKGLGLRENVLFICALEIRVVCWINMWIKWSQRSGCISENAAALRRCVVGHALILSRCGVWTICMWGHCRRCCLLHLECQACGKQRSFIWK